MSGIKLVIYVVSAPLWWIGESVKLEEFLYSTPMRWFVEILTTAAFVCLFFHRSTVNLCYKLILIKVCLCKHARFFNIM